MYLEYNWTALAYQPRFGERFIAVNGLRSYTTIQQAIDELAIVGLALGGKIDSRTWRIVKAQV